MLRVTSINLNGIRSAIRKKFLDWIEIYNPDLVCLQEIRISKDDITEDILNPRGFSGFFHSAKRKGYAGTGVYTKKKPDEVTTILRIEEFDNEGRVMRLDWDKISVINVYIPSGSSRPDRQIAKFKFLDQFKLYLESIAQEYLLTKRNFIICGDWNIAHKKIDIKNWKNNINKPGFLPEERDWMTNIIELYNLVDVFRKLNPETAQYTWWSNRAKSWERNVGWRIDYQITTSNIAKLAISSEVYMERRFSDHAPLSIDYNIEI